MQKTILLLVAGETNSSITDVFGDKTYWFKKILEECGANMQVVEAYKGEAYDESDGDAWIITGSADSVMDNKEWMLYMENKIIKAHALKKPILGVCFGHQILAKALGGEVTRNPVGWEVGSHNVLLTFEGQKTDLFKKLPPTICVYETHQDTVSKLPPSSTLLAENSNGVQSFVDDRSYGIQFHPEFSCDIMRAYSDLNRSQGIEFDADQVIDTKDGKNVMKNFVLKLLG